jgi:hypothetical protein
MSLVNGEASASSGPVTENSSTTATPIYAPASMELTR